MADVTDQVWRDIKILEQAHLTSSSFVNSSIIKSKFPRQEMMPTDEQETFQMELK